MDQERDRRGHDLIRNLSGGSERSLVGGLRSEGVHAGLDSRWAARARYRAAALANRPLARRLLVIGAVLVPLAVLAWLMLSMRGHWFVLDEFDYVEPRAGQGYLEWLISPHNEHTILFTKMWFSTLFSILGFSGYAVYAVPMLVAHGVVAAATVAVSRSAGLGWVISWCAGLVVLCTGAGVGTITWAGQFQYTGSIAAGMIAIWLTTRSSSRRSFIALGVVAVFGAFNGSAFLSLAGAAAVVFLLQGRWVRAATITAPPAGWFVLSRVFFDIPSEYAAQSLDQVLRDSGPLTFAVLDKAITDTVRTAGFTPVVIALVLIGAVTVLTRSVRTRHRDPSINVLATLSLAMASTLVVLVVGRLSRPVADSANGGYSYLLIVLLVPIVAIVADLLLRSRRGRVVLPATALALLALVGLASIGSAGSDLASYKAQGRASLEQAALLASTGIAAFDDSIPAPGNAPTVTWDRLEKWASDGRFRSGNPAPETAGQIRLIVQLRAQAASPSAAAPDDCVALERGSDFVLEPGRSVLLVAASGTTVVADSASGSERLISASTARTRFDSIAEDRIELSVDAASIDACGIR